ncbi:triose-phosphate isomerase [Stratiformator vulcanicus]|uniref:Triosephosphate isomerase n=1 Tax=Stratiformator vulcanicus TaxID=2527980 RepID=A0A517R6F8_9PLAN|nr:triose-phosphate isomerase [Stratiformator vulcanicus]QDT39458.1 Triosephosphate isomerase [Stratiformator vulcanicus]
MRRLYVAGNWKMNTTRTSGVDLATAIAAKVPAEGCPVDVLVAPPFPYLTAVSDAISGSGVKLGAQNAYFEASGAFTGEVAVDMLRDVGCDAVILGHSERRHVLGETDETINRKVLASLEGGLPVILCIGELLEDRKADRTEAILDEQLTGGLNDVSAEQLSEIVLAYEPVWAIGTGETATPEQAQAAHAYTRDWIRRKYGDAPADAIRIQYGGSVKPNNAAELLGQSDVDGALVGGASLKADSFTAIIEAAISVAEGA